MILYKVLKDRYAIRRYFKLNGVLSFNVPGIRRFYSVEGSGPLGVEGRHPPLAKSESCNAISITDPYIIYQNYVKSGYIKPDEYQLRAVKEFQKLYRRIIDYRAPEDLQIKMNLLIRNLELREARELEKEGKLWNISYVKDMMKKDLEAERRDLVLYMTDIEELEKVNTPKGLLVNGEVGCGKSMLMDIFASSLPHNSKMRWHFNNFILWVYGELFRTQQERSLTTAVAKRKGRFDNEFALFIIAQRMIQRNTILMLDEFMLPDIASANIVKVLLTYFFKLGGILVATSNKLPENLYSNAFHRTYFEGFVQILHSRCEVYDMRSDKDYRVLNSLKSAIKSNLVTKMNNLNHEEDWFLLVTENALNIPDAKRSGGIKSLDSLGAKPSRIIVYNRVTEIPASFDNDTICYLDFSYICKGTFASSDYITLASKYKTVILDNVPVMTLKMKNEARRFITLLDALYEAKCQLFMRADVDIDNLFFPEDASGVLPTNIEKFVNLIVSAETLQVQDEETFAKASIDSSNPYRPNVSTYDQEYTASFNEGTVKGEKEMEQVNFKNIKAFTGEDEKFAYKRAVLRIKEMVDSDLWRSSQGWTPIDISMRTWENLTSEQPLMEYLSGDTPHEKFNSLIGDQTPRNLAKSELQDTLPKSFSERNGIPFRYFNRRIAPLFESLQHFWGLGSWKYNQGLSRKDKITNSWINSSSREKK